MKNSEVQAIKTWFDGQRPSELDTALRLTSFKMTGQRSVKTERIVSWLRGVYSAADFEQGGSDDKMSASQTRVQLRKEFLRKMCDTNLAHPRANCTRVCVQTETSQRSGVDQGELVRQVRGQAKWRSQLEID